MPTIEDVIKKYIDLRDRKAEKVKQQAEELAPITEAMGQIENYLMHQMNTLGLSQLKAAGVGTAFKATSTSCQMADPMAFKDFVFAPVASGIRTYLASSGYAIGLNDQQAIADIIREMPMWDMIDFRAGKKGITEYIDNRQGTVPGVNLNTTATVNVRRA